MHQRRRQRGRQHHQEAPRLKKAQERQLGEGEAATAQVRAAVKEERQRRRPALREAAVGRAAAAVGRWWWLVRKQRGSSQRAAPRS